MVYPIEKEENLYYVPKILSPPAMDGTLKGFDLARPTFVFNNSDTLQPIDAAAWGYWSGKDDLSAKIYLAYDKNYFYIAADVLDDIHISRYSGSNIWNQDCIQYAFDTENNSFDLKMHRTGKYKADDREFCMALIPQGPQNYCYTGPAELADKAIPEKINITINGNRKIYEARIPWSYLGKLNPEPGAIFGFNLVLFDMDQKNGVIPYRMELSPGIANGKEPAQFKRFILE